MASTPPPTASDWVVDSRPSYHTTPDADMLSHSHPPHGHDLTRLFLPIVLGNGSTLPTTLVGASVLLGLFHLKNVLVGPNIIQNLFSVRRFTTNNFCSMEFDHFGLSMKDLSIRTLLARCDSSGRLYTLQFPRIDVVVYISEPQEEARREEV